MSARPTGLLTLRLLGLWGTKTVVQGEIDKNSHNDESHDKRDLPSGVPPIEQYPNDSEPVRESSRKIVDLMLEKGTPGLTVCVAKRGHIVWKSAFGYCDVENQVACNPDAQMRIASISKPLFVATVVAPMLEQDKIGLEDSVHKYLSADEFPKQKYQGKEHDITVKQLMSHTSGLKHYVEYQPEKFSLETIGSKGSKKIYQPPDQIDRSGFYQRRTFRNVIEALDPFKDGPLAGEPGKFLYTTYGYTLLSAVAQRAHQAQGNQQATEQIEDFWVKILRRDWGMKNTYLDQDEVVIPRRARYYLRTAFNGGLVNAPFTDLSVKWAGGGINSNTRDIVKFANTLIDCYKERNKAHLKKSTVELLWKEVASSYGLGFKSSSDRSAIYHSGGALGASSFLLILPKPEVVVVILTNMGEVNLGPLAFYIAEQFDKLK